MTLTVTVTVTVTVTLTLTLTLTLRQIGRGKLTLDYEKTPSGNRKKTMDIMKSAI